MFMYLFFLLFILFNANFEMYELRKQILFYFTGYQKNNFELIFNNTQSNYEII